MEKKWAVVARYEHNGIERNEVISRHKTYELAEGALKREGYETFRGIREIDGERIK